MRRTYDLDEQNRLLTESDRHHDAADFYERLGRYEDAERHRRRASELFDQALLPVEDTE